ncbi:MOSC domain-containing protein YiiM [Deinococcus metalli]|uniref:MOSC domain-containing protein n=1 Tax=Deinococcus metalli TaxID=1141878 RepID=A0A7W8KBF8_9DEIO|nr:MOSC domain-containing protein [Deinococcus metalli]MBB5375026.1 MOSC domain-containing protein YiiM [Deinococcus metalli]GHF32002.1 MOSC domain-containing protein [Deinococcus metalli]
MRVLSVCVGQPRAMRSKSGWSGIHKMPVDGPVHVGRLGLAGDHILDTEHHGGVEQAVYIYTAPDYAWWSERLGRPLSPGTFGENLLLSDLESAAVRLGQRFRVGGAVLEVASARVPCVTLAERMGDPAFVKKFRDARRPGVYARVLHEGPVQAGDPVTLLDVAPGMDGTILDNFEAFYVRHPGAATVMAD